MKKLIKEICKREGKKTQTQIGNVREVVSVLSDVLVEGLIDADPNKLGSEYNEYLNKKAKAIFLKKFKQYKAKDIEAQVTIKVEVISK